jgi:probable FeS assembly SUF system protein SufT
MHEQITVSRDMDATAIPSGEPVRIPGGTGATITQALGGSYTLITDMGWMVRVSGKEVEAIGKEVPKEVEISADAAKEDLEPLVWDQMKTCFDPEIPVNIVDLGLVYLCELNDVEGEHGKYDVEVKMTLTAPGCGMGPVLADDVRQKIESLAPIRKANVEIVFDPMWDRSMMSDAAKLQLGMY